MDDAPSSLPIRAGTAAAMLILALGAAACHPAKLGQGRPRDDRPMAVNARLDCPEHQGDLERVDQAADGRSCRYTGDGDQEVTLSFLSLDGRAAVQALAPTEATLRALVPAAVSGSAENAKAEAAAKTKDDDGDDNKADADVDTNTTTGTNRTTVAEWNAGTPEQKRRSGGDHSHVAINLPGIHVDADDDGAHVHAFGQDVDANDGGVELHSGWAGQHALDQSYLLASDTAGPEGVQAAAYYVRGPVAGPLVMAVVKAKSGGRDHDEDRFADARRLVRRNTHFQ